MTNFIDEAAKNSQVRRMIYDKIGICNKFLYENLISYSYNIKQLKEVGYVYFL